MVSHRGCMQEQFFSMGLGVHFAWCHCALFVAALDTAIKHTLSRSATGLTICLQLLLLLCCKSGVHGNQSMLADSNWCCPLVVNQSEQYSNFITFAEMTQYSSGVPGDRHHLKGVPLLVGDDVSLVNITISQKPDGSDWLLGQGSSGKVFRHHYYCYQFLDGIGSCESCLWCKGQLWRGREVPFDRLLRIKVAALFLCLLNKSASKCNLACVMHCGHT